MRRRRRSRGRIAGRFAHRVHPAALRDGATRRATSRRRLVRDPATADVRELVPQGGVKSHPGSQLSWSPDGGWIAFGSQEGELFVIRVDGTVPSRVPIPDTVGDHHAYGPAWSPDGTRLAFSMFVDSRNGTDLYTIAPDGSNLVRITSADGAETFANWGPPDT